MFICIFICVLPEWVYRVQANNIFFTDQYGQNFLHIIIIIYSLRSFHISFHRSLGDSKSPQVSRTLLSILAVLKNVVVWVVSNRPPTSKSSNPCNNPLVTVPRLPITIGIIVTFMCHIVFNPLARSRYFTFL